MQTDFWSLLMNPGLSFLKQVLAVLIRSQLTMAASAVCFVWTCAVLTGHALPVRWYGAAFVGCWGVYLLDAGLLRVPREDLANLPERARFIERARRPLGWGLACALAGLGLGFALIWPPPRWTTWGALALLGVAGAAYVFPLLVNEGAAQPSESGAAGAARRLRVKDVALWKPAFISAVWLAGGMLLPFLEGSPLDEPAASFAAVCTLLFLLLLGDSIALDWRDREGDAAAGVRTAAVRLGRACVGLLAGIAAAAAALVVIVPGDARWRVIGGAMAAAHAASLALLPVARRRPLTFYAGVAAWRFAAPLAWLLLRR